MKRLGSVKAFSELQTLVTSAMLIALSIVLTRLFSYTAPYIRIGLGFLPIAVISMLYGAIPAAFAAALADIIGVVVFTANQTIPLITLSAFIAGFIFGLFLYGNEEISLSRIIVGCVLVVVIEDGLNTIWLSQIFGFNTIIIPRLVQMAMKIPLEIIVLYAFNKKIGIWLRKRIMRNRGAVK